MKSSTIRWVFPQQQIIYRVEIMLLAVLAILIVLLTYFQFYSWSLAIVLGLCFLSMYLIITIAVKHFQQEEHHYKIEKNALTITKKNKHKSKTEKVPLHHVKRHKVDRVLLGGYILTPQKKHLLFFNNKKEIERYHQAMQRHTVKKKK